MRSSQSRVGRFPFPSRVSKQPAFTSRSVSERVRFTRRRKFWKEANFPLSSLSFRSFPAPSRVRPSICISPTLSVRSRPV